MPNVFKSGSTSTNGSIYKGQFTIGVNTNVDFGPTSTTSFWNGIIPASGGYTIYQNKAANGPSIRTAANNTQLVTILQSMGSTGSTAANVLDWASQQANIMVANLDYPSIVTSGMVLIADAGYVSSYPTQGTTWRDLSGNGYNGTLINGPTFNSGNGGNIVFDGINDYADIAYSLTPTYFTIELIAKPGNISTGNSKVFLGKYNNSGNDYWIGLQGTDSSIVWSVNGGSLDSDIIPNTTSYYIITAVIGSTLQKIYVNGTLSKTTNTTVTSPGGNIALARFGQNDGFYTSVSIGGLKIYNRELTDSEVLQNYNAQKSRFGL